MGFLDRFKPKETTPEEREAEYQKIVGYGFTDYWWLRDTFMRTMMDIKGPITVPWYHRTSVTRFISFWDHPYIIKAIRVRLTQVDRMDEYTRVEKLHTLATEQKDFFAKYHVTEEDIEAVRSFMDEAAIALYCIDKWFKRDYWPDDFKPADNQGEFENTSIETAMMHAPFRR